MRRQVLNNDKRRHLLMKPYHRSETRQGTAKAATNRITLIPVDSVLQKCGFFSSYTWEVRQDVARRNVFCLGFRFPEWLTFSSVSLEFASVTSVSSVAWTLQHNLNIVPRVSANSSIMQACRQGDVATIRTILQQGGGGINDRTSCSGTTPLLVSDLSTSSILVDGLKF